jgi:SAM-dependent methyltransferase
MKKPWSTQTSEQGSWSYWRRANFNFFKKHLEHCPSSDTLIDIGAGPLQFRDIFKRFKYVGVDFVTYQDVSVVADLTKPLPIENNSAEIVVLSNTLEHIPEPLPLLKECERIVKTGGLVVGTVPFLVQVHQAPYDFNRYTHYQLSKLLTEAGFINIEVTPLGALIDAYSTAELKFFVHLPGHIKLPFRLWRRFEMKVLRTLFGQVPANEKFTEGYGFIGRKK